MNQQPEPSTNDRLSLHCFCVILVSCTYLLSSNILASASQHNAELASLNKPIGLVQELPSAPRLTLPKLNIPQLIAQDLSNTDTTPVTRFASPY